MKKVKAMNTTELKTKVQAVKSESKKSHIRLVKPAETVREPGTGCRPTGVQ